jgi:hypothetical protein
MNSLSTGRKFHTTFGSLATASLLAAALFSFVTALVFIVDVGILHSFNWVTEHLPIFNSLPHIYSVEIPWSIECAYLSIGALLTALAFHVGRRVSSKKS